MPASKNQNYLHGAAILVVATIITKILGAIYKIPLGNILGNDGFAYFNVAYNLYNVLLALSTAGLPIALSRLISESNNLKRPEQIKRTYRVASLTFIALGAVGSAIMSSAPDRRAQLSLSEPQEVKKTSSALPPRALATLARETSKTALASRPIVWVELGLP